VTGATVPETEVDGADFAEFVDGSLPALLRFGYLLTGSAQEAEDLVQDALANHRPGSARSRHDRHAPAGPRPLRTREYRLADTGAHAVEHIPETG